MSLSLRCLAILFVTITTGSLYSSGETTPERTFSELKVYSVSGTPWRVPVEDWAGARLRVAQDPQWADWLKKERKTVDDWMANRRDRVEWACGWFHDFV